MRRAGQVKIGIIGDFDATRLSHAATNDSIRHAAAATAMDTEFEWVSTPSMLREDAHRVLERYDGLWASPGSPYQSMEGALRAIQFARERDWPFVAT